MNLRRLLAYVVLALWAAAGRAAEGQVANARTVVDQQGDALRRPMLNLGTNGTASAGTNQALQELLFFRIGSWEPLDATQDLFRGQWANVADFFRLDLVFEGLVNPPGTIGCCGNPFNPFLYGPRPLFGYIEIDMDADTSTGGDLDFPNLMYLGNVGRFGGLPAGPRLDNRAAADGRAFDGNIMTPPFVDRSGEEFHIAMDGLGIHGIERPDATEFGPGETWVLFGTLFHRASGYEDFSSACCSGAPGSYNPIVRIQFSHSIEFDRTVVSLVYPLTNAGSAAAVGPAPAQALDNIVDNQNSVHEGLNELFVSATFASETDRQDPNFAIIAGWQSRDALDYLDPLEWEVTVLAGGSYREPGTGDIMLAWSDVLPNVVPGDFDANSEVNGADIAAFNNFFTQNDGDSSIDQDQTPDGVIHLVNFIPNFSVYDLNYDGMVTPDDRPSFVDSADYDGDNDGDVDLRDYWILQRCLAESPPTPLEQACARFDGNADGTLNADDLSGFVNAMTGPE